MERGKKLRQLREKKNLSQTEAARFIGVSKQSLFKYENDIITNIPSDVIERIAKFYETTPAYIMGWDSADVLQDADVPMSTKIKNPSETDTQKAVDLYNQIKELPQRDQEELFSYLQFLRTKSDSPHSNS